MRKRLSIVPLALLLVAGSALADKGAAPELYDPYARTWDVIPLDTASGPFCETYTVDATRYGPCRGSSYVYLGFTLEEELCDWEISSCGDLSADTAFWLYHENFLIAENDDWSCPDGLSCTGWTPAVLGSDWNGGCLAAGEYILQIKVFSVHDVDNACEELCEDAPFTVCFDFGPGEGDTAQASDLPEGFSLSPNYPNPFNPATTLRYSLPETERARLRVYDLGGALVRSLLDEVQARGAHSLGFHAGDLPSGTYLLRLEAGEYSATRKMVLLR